MEAHKESEQESSQTPGGGLDRLGAVASGLCAAHCATAAFTPALLSALGVGVLIGHEAERAFTGVAVAIAFGALVYGWRRHRSPVVAALLVLGIAGLLASRLLEGEGGHDEHHASHLLGTLLGIGAGLTLISGHILGLRGSSSR